MPDYRDLTDFQLALLGILWDRGDATVADIYDALHSEMSVSRKTIATVLSRLEKRGLVRRRLVANAGVYTPAVTRRAVVISRMASVLGAVFAAPAGGAGPSALERGEVRAGDAARLRKLLRKAERDISNR